MAGLGDYGLRLGGVDSAGVDVTDSTRLSQHLSENRHGRRSCCGGVVDSPGAANAGADKIHRWKRIGVRRPGFSFCLHYHRVRCCFGVSFAYRFGNNAEDAGARVTDSRHRLRCDDYRDDGRVNGDDRGVRDSAGRILCHQYQGTPTEVVAKVSAAGFPVTEPQMADLARNLGEQTMFNRAGGAPTFAVGMAHMFARVSAGPTALALWYHFAIMFEALFILTTIDAGTRVGRFLLQDLLGNLWRPLGNTRSWVANSFASTLLVAAWGWFLYQGVIDPLGGINTLWPLFGLANQLLSVIALCLGTTVLIKMGKARYLFITIVPLLFMAVVTFSAGYMKIFSPDPNLGLLASARLAIQKSAEAADAGAAAMLIRQATMYRIDVFVAASFLVLVLLIVIGSAVEWYRLLVGHKRVQLQESEFVPLAEVATS